MDFKVLSVLKKYMSDDEYKAFEDKGLEFEKALGGDITKYIEANTPKKEDLEKTAKETAHAEIIQELGIDSVKTVQELKDHMKVVADNTTDKDKALVAVTKERDDLKVNYDKEVESRTKLEGDNKLTKQMTAVRSLGVTDEDELEFLHFKFNKAVTDDKDFNTVVAEYAKENGVKTSTKFVKDDFSKAKGEINIGEVYKENQAKYRK